MNLAAARVALAGALNTVASLNVADRGPVGAAVQGDGWVLVRGIKPGERFGPGLRADLEAIIVAGTDEATAEAYVDQVAPGLVSAVLVADQLYAAVSLATQALLTTTTQAPVYVLAVSATVDVEP
jgi:hypothetical protein